MPDAVPEHDAAGRFGLRKPRGRVIHEGRTMRAAQRLVALGFLALGLIGGVGIAPTAAQTPCDPAYISACVPPVSDVGDLDCQYFYDRGISNIQLADPANDPHGLDGWNHVDDGIGCEGG